MKQAGALMQRPRGRRALSRLALTVPTAIVAIVASVVPLDAARPESAAIFGPTGVVVGWVVTCVFAYTYGAVVGIAAAICAYALQAIAIHVGLHDAAPYPPLFALATATIDVLSGAFIGRLREFSVRLRRSERRFRALTAHISDLVLLVDARGVATYASPSHESLLGREPSALLGRGYREIFDERGLARLDAAAARARAGVPVERFEVTAVARDGTRHVIDMQSYNCFADRAVAGIVLSGRDISERKRSEVALQTQAYYDPLTELPNRTSLLAQLNRQLARASDRAPFALIFADLDRFKEINDSFGHDVGDAVLHEVAQRIRSSVGSDGVAGRLGGDEFAVIVANGGDGRGRDVAERIRRAIVRPIEIDRRVFNVDASFGIAIASEPCEPAQILRQADLAMYAEKRSNGREAATTPSSYDPSTARSSA